MMPLGVSMSKECPDQLPYELGRKAYYDQAMKEYNAKKPTKPKVKKAVKWSTNKSGGSKNKFGYKIGGHD